MGGQNLHGWHWGNHCNARKLSTYKCWEGSKPSGVTYGLRSSNTKRHQGESCESSSSSANKMGPEQKLKHLNVQVNLVRTLNFEWKQYFYRVDLKDKKEAAIAKQVTHKNNGLISYFFFKKRTKVL